MTTLTINGQKVKVSDDFLKLSPEQQNATVDEISKSMGAATPSMPKEWRDMTAAERGAATRAGTAPKPSAETIDRQKAFDARSGEWASFEGANPGMAPAFIGDTRALPEGLPPEVGSKPFGGEMSALASGMPSIMGPGAMLGAYLASPTVQSPEMSSTEALVHALAQGGTLGWGDEAAAKLTSMATGKPYDEVLGEFGDRIKKGAELYPTETTGGNVIGGAMAPGLGTGSLIAKTPGVIGKTLVGAGSGAIFGATDAAGRADPGERVAAMPRGAIVGGALGGAATGIPAIIASLMNSSAIKNGVRVAAENAPDFEDAKAWAKSQYDELSNTTPPMAQDEFARDWAGKIEAEMQPGRDKYGLGGASRTPEIDALIAKVDDLSGSERFRGGVPYDAAHELRMSMSDIAKATQEGRPIPSSVSASGGARATDDMLDAMTGGKMNDVDTVYRRVKTAERVQDMMDAAEGYQSGFGSGIRNQFRAALRTPKNRRGLSEGVQQAMKAEIGGGPIERLLRTGGGGLGRLMALGGGYAGGGLGGAVAGHAAAEGMQSLAEASSRSNVEAIVRAIMGGNLKPAEQISDDVIAVIADRLRAATVPGINQFKQ